MANVATAVAAAAGRDPAVDRSLRSVFGKRPKERKKCLITGCTRSVWLMRVCQLAKLTHFKLFGEVLS